MPLIRKILLLGLIITAAAVAVAPAAAYGGFTVNLATITFNTTTGSSLTTTTPQSTIAQVNVYQYMLARSSGPIISTDKNSTGTNIAKITIVLNLAPPTGQNPTPITTNIQGSIGTRTHTIYLGPGEGVTAKGNYALTMSISVQIVTPQGAPVEALSETLVTAFTVA